MYNFEHHDSPHIHFFNFLNNETSITSKLYIYEAFSNSVSSPAVSADVDDVGGDTGSHYVLLYCVCYTHYNYLETHPKQFALGGLTLNLKQHTSQQHP